MTTEEAWGTHMLSCERAMMAALKALECAKLACEIGDSSLEVLGLATNLARKHLASANLTAEAACMVLATAVEVDAEDGEPEESDNADTD